MYSTSAASHNLFYRFPREKSLTLFFAHNDGQRKCTLSFGKNGAFCHFERSEKSINSIFSSPLFVFLWILRLTPQYDKILRYKKGESVLAFFVFMQSKLLVFKSSFQKDGASASDDIAVFIDYGAAVVVVVVIVKGVENIFYTRCYRSHTFVETYSQAKVAH